jgi:hypothetical protein
MKHTLLISIAVLLGLCACSSIDCPVENVVRTLYVMKKPTLAADTLKDTLDIVSRRVDGTMVTLRGSLIQKDTIQVAIGYVNPEDTLFFNFRNGSYRATDTVWIKKDNRPHFESVDCAVAYFHTVTAVRCTNHAIDSIRLNNPSVTYDPRTENFYLYLKARN